MTRRTIGQAVIVLGVVVASIGVIGMVTTAGSTPAATPTPSQTASSRPAATPTSSGPAPSASESGGVVFVDGTTDPPDDVYTCADGTAADPQPRVDITEVTYRPSTTNPATDSEASSLLLSVRDAFATDHVGSEAVVILGSGTIEAMPSADGLHTGVGTIQVRMTFTGPGDPPFTKTARRWDGTAWNEADASAYNVRFEGLGDHVEFEFFAPPATTFAAALVTDTDVCDVVAAS